MVEFLGKTPMTQWVYAFSEGRADGRAHMANLLGGKGANLAEMCALNLPVPPGFTITTDVCRHYYAHEKQFPTDLTEQVDRNIKALEALMGCRFGDAYNPLLVSVRSGAASSMPGMLDTVLNLGLNDQTVQGLARVSQNGVFALDSYRRFIQMFGNVVLDMGHDDFEDILQWHKDNKGATYDTDLDENDWQGVIRDYKAKVHEITKEPFPQDSQDQLWRAIRSVFNSWENQRARVYRQIHNISPHLGTAVNIQVMVFGNRGQDCATGVAFTRNPSTGTKAIFGEYLINAQGEDVVAGIRTPLSLSKATSEEPETSMEATMPTVYNQLLSVSHTLEQHFKDMQDIEFTVQNKKLWMLQTRNGKRTAAASLKIAVDMVAEGLITKEDAVLRVTPESLDQLLHPTLDPKAKKTFLAKGLPASPGAACGSIVFTADEAEARTRKGDAVILVRAETSPEDIHGMHAARGILTSKGGMTSHAAVVARGMGKPCVSGASSVRIDAKKKVLTVAGQTFGEGDFITLDGATGEVFAGKVPTVDPNISGDFRTFMTWADGFRTLKVLTNAETPVDAQTARDFGAEGIGLCRTEHMFFAEDRLRLVREMILADNAQERVRPLQALQAMQRDDFVTILKTMAGYPVMIRLLDPPLHEFMHLHDHELADLAQHVGKSVDAVRSRLEKLKESNPMLGHRGCRLGISYPDIYEMQVRAIFQAQHIATQAIGTAAQPQIMLPLIANRAEMTLLTTMIHGVAAECFRALGHDLPYVVGTMIELPRACLVADELAESADFFSFGSNDLTQTTYGLSRDDAGSFLDAYYSQGLLSHDPFVTLDQQGVGALITMAIDRGRATKPTLKVGICGEHGGDPASIHFCHQQGMDYVSCSPYRVPIARLAAAQAALKIPKGQDQKRQVG